jgi:hypothetical protein
MAPVGLSGVIEDGMVERNTGERGKVSVLAKTAPHGKAPRITEKGSRGVEPRLAAEGEVSGDAVGQHNRGRAKALWVEVAHGIGRTSEIAVRLLTPMQPGRVPSPGRRRWSTIWLSSLRQGSGSRLR